MMQALESLGCELRLARDGRNYTAVPKTRRVKPSQSSLQVRAQVFRQQYDKEHSDGYVIFFRGKPVAWKLFLDHPSGWEPGCLAIDKEGRQWIAAGGDIYQGAMRWDPRPADASNVTRMPARIRDIRQPGPGAA
ncbi:MAG: hypothetical protein SVX28_11710 [Pseudomonadota bacterium]|nr:hypothetical protein [Pseudomonadota bacterium]